MSLRILRRCCTSEVLLASGLRAMAVDVTFGSCGAGVAQADFAAEFAVVGEDGEAGGRACREVEAASCRFGSVRSAKKSRSCPEGRGRMPRLLRRIFKERPGSVVGASCDSARWRTREAAFFWSSRAAACGPRTERW